MKAILPLTITMVLVSPYLFAQEADAPEPAKELLEGVVEGDEADQTVEEFLKELREETRVRREEIERERASADESQTASAPPTPCGLDAVFTAIADGDLETYFTQPCARRAEQP